MSGWGIHLPGDDAKAIMADTAETYYFAGTLITIFCAYADLDDIRYFKNGDKYIFRAPVEDLNVEAFFEMRPSYVNDLSYELHLYLGTKEYNTQILYIFTGKLEKILAALGPGALATHGISVDIKPQRIALPSPFGRWFFGFLERAAVIASDLVEDDVHPTKEFPDFPKET